MPSATRFRASTRRCWARCFEGCMAERRLGIALLTTLMLLAPARAHAAASVTLPYELPELGGAAIRGVTIGPIESALHPGRGYGSPAYERCLDEAVRLGATWISLTPFGRAWDLQATGIDKTFELPFAE